MRRCCVVCYFTLQTCRNTGMLCVATLFLARQPPKTVTCTLTSDNLEEEEEVEVEEEEEEEEEKKSTLTSDNLED